MAGGRKNAGGVCGEGRIKSGMGGHGGFVGEAADKDEARRLGSRAQASQLDRQAASVRNMVSPLGEIGLGGTLGAWHVSGFVALHSLTDSITPRSVFNAHGAASPTAQRPGPRPQSWRILPGHFHRSHMTNI